MEQHQVGLCLLLNVVVHAANLHDRESVNLLLEPAQGQFPLMEQVWVEQGSTGKGKTWIQTEMGWTVARRGAEHRLAWPFAPDGQGV